MTVHEFSVNSQQSTVNSQRLECGIIYFLEFPWKTSLLKSFEQRKPPLKLFAL
ncbi:hypothetical protein LC613_20420 [Nostoc sphaeroides CHAB 2801]|uniref:hypothetical protein n=1 Tax=Nostoc sphaeroides TaxID=446679 RepID=UPI001C704558|nr:hypothetical protein [Nostoc sphaeroides]MCC5630251.1 hypothetical protein [Nostoc sphaeroides CHAB 2801]